jgi:hypothetical protein
VSSVGVVVAENALLDRVREVPRFQLTDFIDFEVAHTHGQLLLLCTAQISGAQRKMPGPSAPGYTAAPSIPDGYIAVRNFPG